MAVRGVPPGRPGGRDDPHRERRWGEQPDAPPAGRAPSARSCIRRCCSRARVRRSAAFGVVCGIVGDKPGGGCSPSGSVFVRAAGEPGSASGRWSASREGLLSASYPRPRPIGGFDYYARSTTAAGRARRSRKPDAAAPQHVWPLESWTKVDLGAARFGRLPAAVFGRRQLPRGGGATARSGSTAAANSRGSARRRSTSLRTAPSSCSTRSIVASCGCGVVGSRPSCRSPSPAARVTSPWATTGRSTCSNLGEAAASLVLTRRGPDFRGPARRAGGRHGARGPVGAARARLSVRDVAADRRGSPAADRGAAARAASRRGASTEGSAWSSMRRRPRSISRWFAEIVSSVRGFCAGRRASARCSWRSRTETGSSWSSGSGTSSTRSSACFGSLRAESRRASPSRRASGQKRRH